MIDPGDVFDPMLAEVNRVLLEMKKTKDLGQRKMQSEIVKNLCESLGVFFDTMGSALAWLEIYRISWTKTMMMKFSNNRIHRTKTGD